MKEQVGRAKPSHPDQPSGEFNFSQVPQQRSVSMPWPCTRRQLRPSGRSHSIAHGAGGLGARPRARGAGGEGAAPFSFSRAGLGYHRRRLCLTEGDICPALHSWAKHIKQHGGDRGSRSAFSPTAKHPGAGRSQRMPGPAPTAV